jgi:hypothetical protein
MKLFKKFVRVEVLDTGYRETRRYAEDTVVEIAVTLPGLQESLL